MEVSPSPNDARREGGRRSGAIRIDFKLGALAASIQRLERRSEVARAMENAQDLDAAGAGSIEHDPPAERPIDNPAPDAAQRGPLPAPSVGSGERRLGEVLACGSHRAVEAIGDRQACMLRLPKVGGFDVRLRPRATPNDGQAVSAPSSAECATAHTHSSRRGRDVGAVGRRIRAPSRSFRAATPTARTFSGRRAAAVARPRAGRRGRRGGRRGRRWR